MPLMPYLLHAVLTLDWASREVCWTSSRGLTLAGDGAVGFLVPARHRTEPSMPASVPVIDLRPWFSRDEAARAGVAAEVDAALHSVGFFLISGHGVPEDLRARVRAQARAFFALAPGTKQRYAVT